jgi:hypothetical protein
MLITNSKLSPAIDRGETDRESPLQLTHRRRQQRNDERTRRTGIKGEKRGDRHRNRHVSIALSISFFFLLSLACCFICPVNSISVMISLIGGQASNFWPQATFHPGHSAEALADGWPLRVAGSQCNMHDMTRNRQPECDDRQTICSWTRPG